MDPKALCQPHDALNHFSQRTTFSTLPWFYLGFPRYGEHGEANLVSIFCCFCFAVNEIRSVEKRDIFRRYARDSSTSLEPTAVGTSENLLSPG